MAERLRGDRSEEAEGRDPRGGERSGRAANETKRQWEGPRYRNPPRDEAHKASRRDRMRPAKASRTAACGPPRSFPLLPQEAALPPAPPLFSSAAPGIAAAPTLPFGLALLRPGL